MLRSLARFRAARAALQRKSLILPGFPRNCSKLAEDHCGEAVCGNQVMIFTCIVRRPKTGPSHSGISYGRAKAVVLQRFPRIALFNCPWPDESVRRLLTVALLCAQCVENFVGGLSPLRREHLCAACCLPIRPCEPNRVAQRIRFILPLPSPRRENGFVLIQRLLSGFSLKALA